MSGVYVIYRDLIVEDFRGEGRYADWKVVHDFDVKGVALSTKAVACWDHIVIAPAVLPGDEVWVLWYTYRSGDSFGTEDGQGEILWVFTDEAVAQKALHACEARRRDRGFVFSDEDGEDIHLSNAASGYFERIDEFHLKSFIVTDDFSADDQERMW